MFATPVKKTGRLSGKYQQGVAIITALLIVTLAATVSITISTQLQLDIRRTGNVIVTDQAHIYSLLAEKTLQVILQDDDLREGLIETLIKEGIAKQPLFIDNASIVAEVTDLNACLNINSLVIDGIINTVNEARLKRLFDNNALSGTLTAAIADWIDPDLNTSIPNGAEDGYYLTLEKAYRTAQRPLYSISELRLIKGFEDNQLYQAITQLVEGTIDEDSGRFSGPQLCAFNTPDNEPYSININTASVEVLKSLQPGITEDQLNNILQQRTEKAYTSVPDVFTAPNREDLVFKSSYYLLKSKVVIGNASNVMYSIIHWDETKKSMTTLYRTLRTL